VAKARKRRPGGGRKPGGIFRGKTEWFSTRITPETREALEREATTSGQPISQVAERLLVLGLEAKRWRDHYKPLRALCFVIERTALAASSGRYLDPTDPIWKRDRWHAMAAEDFFNDWRTDPFRYRAFRLAVASLLSALEPKGEIRSPYDLDRIEDPVLKERLKPIYSGELIENPAIKELMKRTYESPENFAAYIFSIIWRDLSRNYPLSEKEKFLFGRAESVGQMILAEIYQMGDARHDLGLDAEPEGGKS
jgi:hypothetical protein